MVVVGSALQRESQSEESCERDRVVLLPSPRAASRAPCSVARLRVGDCSEETKGRRVYWCGGWDGVGYGAGEMD